MPDNPLPQIITRAEAKACGLDRYFTGKPCKHGHVAQRYKSGRCVVCVVITNKRHRKPGQSKQYYWADPVKGRTRTAKWRKEHPEESATQRRRRDPAKLREAALVQYRKDPAAAIARAIDWANRNRLKRRATMRKVS